jgi:hypothetical protein
MTARTAGRLARGLCGLTCTLLVVGLVLAVLEPSSAGPLGERFPGVEINRTLIYAALTATLAGAIWLRETER